ncbi:MAG TPA: RNA polymerase subunit sigma-70 [Chloroflexota bacterium]|nr:RNA polymerase subunit sigma-70 [Chloroflexota bacterium]
MSGSALDRARAGNEEAFRDLIAPHVRELHLHCYRMLGSLADADDLLQETLAAAWLGLGSFAGRSSLRTWLYRIATNRCLNAARETRRRAPPQPVPPFAPPEPSRQGEVTWLQPYPDAWLLEQAPDRAPGPEARSQARETVELAFIAALQRLPPRQTAALLLCDVLSFSAAEAAGMLETSPTAIKGVLQRARSSLRHQRGRTEQGHPPRAGSAVEQDLARRFAIAYVEDDIDGVLALLTDNAWLAMPPAPHEYYGPEAIASFLRASAGWRRPRQLRLVPTRANTQPAFGCYVTDPDGSMAHATSLLVLTLSKDRIRGITRFLDRGLLRMFGLADSVY